MERLNAIRMLVVLFAVFIPNMPARAQAQDVILPELAPVTTLRHNFVFAFNGRPLQVCQAEWESWNRSHGTCRDLVTVPEWDLIENYVREVVRYDGTAYIRDNDETVWTALPDEQYAPDVMLNDALYSVNFAATLSQIGTVDINGIPTIQYQYWSLDEALNELAGGQVVYDLFISAENRVIKDQISARGTILGLGDGELSSIWLYSDFDTAITVSPPPAELVQAADPGMQNVFHPLAGLAGNHR